MMISALLLSAVLSYDPSIGKDGVGDLTLPKRVTENTQAVLLIHGAGTRGGRAEWLRGSVGVSVHWTAAIPAADGSKVPFEEAVDRFDVKAFADALAAVGAKHLIFTTAHGLQYLPMPNAALDAIAPGRTTRRDLFGEILDACAERGIRVIAYYNHSCNSPEPDSWKNACACPFPAVDRDIRPFASNICSIVRCMSDRYGRRLAGWWFDSSYSVDSRGPHTYVDGVWHTVGRNPYAGPEVAFPWDELIAAARSGNPDAAVAINAGVGRAYQCSADADYYAGETAEFDDEPDGPLPAGLVDTRWTTLDDPNWTFSAKRGFLPLRRSPAELRTWTLAHLAAGRAVTFNVLVDRNGRLNPAVSSLKDVFAPISLKAGESYVFDFGPEGVGGYPSVAFAGTEGPARIRLAYATHPDGLGPKGDFWHETRANYMGPDLWLPILPASTDRFDVFGQTGAGTWRAPLAQGLVRYAKLTVESGAATVRGVRFVNDGIHSEEPLAGSFSCSDERVNGVWRASVRTCRLAAIPARTKPLAVRGVHTNAVLGTTYAYLSDGAKRDRLVWSGDLWFAQRNMYAAFASDSPYMPGSIRMLAENRTPDGYVQACPFPESHGPLKAGDYGPFASDEFAAWFIPVLCDHVLHTGDLGLAREMRGVVRDLVAYLDRHTAADGVFEQRLETCKHSCGLAVGGTSLHHRSYMNVLNWLAYRDAARLAAWLGDAADAAARTALADRTARAVRREFWDAEKGHFRLSREERGMGFEANALALAAEFATREEAERILPQLTCNWHGKFQLLAVRGAFAYGAAEKAMELVAAHNWYKYLDPGWKGLRTVQECANLGTKGWGDEAHPDACLAGVFTDHLLGVEPVEPGYRRFRVRPQPTKTVTSASGSVSTPYGPISVAWRLEDGKVVLDVKAPEGTEQVADFTPTVRVGDEGREVAVERMRCSAMPVNIRWPGHQRELDQTEICHFARFDFRGETQVRVTVPEGTREVVVRPVARKVAVSREGNVAVFTLKRPGAYSVEFDGRHRNLMVFADPPHAWPDVDRAAANVRWFGPGEHEVGVIRPKAGETIFLDEGAVVYGRIEARDADGLRICGRGILDASRVKEVPVQIDPKLAEEQRRKGWAITNVERFDAIRLMYCDDVRIEGITVRDSQIYAIRPVCCDRFTVDNIRILGSWRYNSDGIDMHNCRHVRIRDSFIRTYDDSICVKGFDYILPETEMLHEGVLHDVFEDVLVERCTIWNDWGRALEIGAETRAREIRGITFRDIDVLAVHGVALDVQNCDQAHVRDVVFENIRVEYDPDAPKTVLSASAKDFDPASRRDLALLAGVVIHYVPEYSKAGAENRGRTSNVAFRDIDVFAPSLPSGFCHGFDADHRVTGVTFADIRLNGRDVTAEFRAKVDTNAFADLAAVDVPLWPAGGMPSVQTNQAVPFLRWFVPGKRTTDAVLIAVSGGGYYGSGVEGFEVAPMRDYFLKKGMTVVTMRYRTPRPQGLAKHVTAWQDAQRTVRLVRSEAAKRGLNPDNIGFTGCSAGGHLAVMVAVSSQTPAYPPVDEIDRLPCNVNWAIPVYPAYLVADGADRHNVKRGNDLADALVPELAFDAATPPMCFFHGDEDGCLAVGAVGEADSDRIRGTRRFVSQRADSKLRNPSKGEG